jgi:hypothetical protein
MIAPAKTLGFEAYPKAWIHLVTRIGATPKELGL